MYLVDPSLTITTVACGLGLTPLLLSGKEDLQKKFLQPFLSGEGEPLASLMHSEPEGTANWLEKGGKGLQTTAKQDGNDWFINGEKVSSGLPNGFITTDCVSVLDHKLRWLGLQRSRSGVSGV